MEAGAAAAWPVAGRSLIQRRKQAACISWVGAPSPAPSRRRSSSSGSSENTAELREAITVLTVAASMPTARKRAAANCSQGSMAPPSGSL